MENRLRLDTQVDTKLASDFELVADPSKRTFLRAAGLLIAGLMAPQGRARQSLHGAADPGGHKVVVVIPGGVRHAVPASSNLGPLESEDGEGQLYGQ